MKNKDLYLIILILLSSCFFVVANFYTKLFKKESIVPVVLISVFLAICEYSIKIPAIYYFGKERSSVYIYSLLLASTFIMTLLFSRFVLKEDVHQLTYIILSLIILLLFINEYAIEQKYVL